MINSTELLTSYVDALRPIIHINHFDTAAVDDLLAEVCGNAEILEYNNAFGAVDFKGKSPMFECELESFLNIVLDEGHQKQTFIVLRDIQKKLETPAVIALLKRIAEKTLSEQEYYCTVFIVSTEVVIPPELENYITLFDFPLPGQREIERIIDEFSRENGIEIDSDVKDIISLSLGGLSEFQINQILNFAFLNGGNIVGDDKKLILSEKKQLIKKSGMLEMVNFSGGIESVGGLENLKDWLKNKAEVFKNLEKALKFGVDVPKGILIVGMPGCGKSLTAKATASLFGVPLVRLDIGNLLGKYVGESENNLRKALRISEGMSPCVLWVDEIEKAFSGVNSSDDGGGVTTRLFGQFLTWMQEKASSVFVVATANNISSLPGEFLRKGRFDELFFVDLPTEAERKKIFEIHLGKRGKMNDKINLDTLIKKTEGYSGADIESVVNETIERLFIRSLYKEPGSSAAMTTDDLLETIETARSITDTLGLKLDEIRLLVEQYDIRPASKKTAQKAEPKGTNDPAGPRNVIRFKRYTAVMRDELDENEREFKENGPGLSLITNMSKFKKILNPGLFDDADRLSEALKKEKSLF